MEGHVLALLLFMAISISISMASFSPKEYNEVKVPDYMASSSTTRPPHSDKERRARYIVHKANWALLATISTKSETLGRAFPGPLSIADGPLGNSSGTPYFYLAAIGSVMQDVAKNPNVTLAFSEAEFSDISDCYVTSSSDPENPLCSRLMLFGKMLKVTDAQELAFAKSALFSRHPLMPKWPSSHDFEFMKMEIEDIWILDYYGPGSFLTVQDYYSAKP